MSFSEQIKKSTGGDEYYSPQNVVDMILPFLVQSGYKKIWCPFDLEESRYVQTFQKMGLEVSFGHIATGQDFFDYEKPQGEIVISNPPFSKRDAIFRKLYDMRCPFALVMNFNGLFDSKARAQMFAKNGVELLIPYGRMKFEHEGEGLLNKPNFQSVYVCHEFLKSPIVFSGAEF